MNGSKLTFAVCVWDEAPDRGGDGPTRREAAASGRVEIDDAHLTRAFYGSKRGRATTGKTAFVVTGLTGPEGRSRNAKLTRIRGLRKRESAPRPGPAGVFLGR